jgi:hypothetical protein
MASSSGSGLARGAVLGGRLFREVDGENT